MNDEASFMQYLLLISGAVFIIILGVVAFIAAIIAYGSWQYSRGRSSEDQQEPVSGAPRISMQVIEEDQLPVPVRRQMYTQMIKQAEAREDFEFAAVLRDKLKALPQ
jgi:TRAP-type C4-dicarboxylate transport system permease small subunit